MASTMGSDTRAPAWVRFASRSSLGAKRRIGRTQRSSSPRGHQTAMTKAKAADAQPADAKPAEPVAAPQSEVQRKCHDLPFALLFVLAFGLTVALACAYGSDVLSYSVDSDKYATVSTVVSNGKAKYKYALRICAGISGGALVASLLWTLVMLVCGKMLIWCVLTRFCGAVAASRWADLVLAAGSRSSSSARSPSAPGICRPTSSSSRTRRRTGGQRRLRSCLSCSCCSTSAASATASRSPPPTSRSRAGRC